MGHRFGVRCLQFNGERMTRRSDEGIALIAVLWVLILLSIIVASVSRETCRDVSVSRNMVDIAMARAAADAGIQRAILDLVSVPNPEMVSADGSIYAWRFANSTVHISIRNEWTKIDDDHAPEISLRPLADAIADFRDRDNLPAQARC